MHNKSSSDVNTASTDTNTGIQFVADLLQKASDGRALQGIYFTGKMEDVLAERMKLVAAPRNITDALERARTMNLQSADVLQMELPELAKKGFCVFMPTGGQQLGPGERQANTLQRTSLYFEEKDLCLSEAALANLKTIANDLKSLSEEDKIKRLADFFKHFGSHAVAGHIIIESNNLRDTPTQGDNEMRLVTPMDQNKMPMLSSEQYSKWEKEKNKKTATKKEIKGNRNSVDRLNNTESAHTSEHDRIYETVNKEKCGNRKNKSRENTENEMQCQNTAENKFTNKRETYNEKNEPINDSNDYDVVDEEEINTQERTSEALSVPSRGCYLVPVWTLIECAGKEYFPNACQVAAALKRAYEAMSGLQPDKPIVEEVTKLTDMATTAFSALQNMCTDPTPAGWKALMDLQNYLQELTKKTSPWRNLSVTSITSLLSLLFLCPTPTACFVQNAKNSHSTDEKQRNVSQMTVERCEAQIDTSATAAASNAVGAQTLQPHDVTITKVNETVDDLLLRLGLKDYFPNGLGRSQFHAVRVNTTDEGDYKDVPPNKLVSQFIHMLRAGDSNIRQLGYLADTDDTESTAESESPVHPVDLLLCVFLCADDFMRQHMFLRLSAAQLALPFVIPMPHSAGLEIPLWSFRAVLKSVLSSTTPGEQRLREMSVCDAEFPIVCFVRYGQSALSKTDIANKVLNDRQNVVFFDRGCNNNVESRVLMNGLAEIYWYCPTGKKKDEKLNKFAAIVNLRGDAFEHHQLAAYLHDIASVNVIFCTKANYEKMDADMAHGLKEKPLIWVSEDMKPSNEGQEKVIRCKNNYDASTVNKIREYIKKGLEGPVMTRSLSDFAVHGQQKHGIKLDDGCEKCINVKTDADNIINLISSVTPEKAKEELLPLSNCYFKLWCKADQDSAQLKVGPGVSVEQREDEIEREKGSVRRHQAEKAQESKLLNVFIDKLKSLTPKGRLFLLRWLEIQFNARSSKFLAELRAEYAQLDNSIYQQKRSKESDAMTRVNALTKKLDALKQKIDASTFGLEHCLREVAQMYEAMHDQKDAHCSDLPRIAAELMKDGEPLELMDGDACYVPVAWVGAVLGELHKMVGGKKVFVLSVLGVQSSGKSTLLNTMFGLRFAVSAGRCTRGAFMQLVEIAEERARELGYDYVLVIDTEGLRSQELSGECSLERDNKMASLVIGLANMTLINVYGESVSEVKDFIQIAVHAFLRMREVKLTPGCVFVHQNVPAADAEDKNTEARRSLGKQLDEMTVEAGKQEDISVQCFNDVIKSDTPSYYFSSLFMGDPPMASLNPSYGKRVCEVRNTILEGAKGQSVLSILDFSIRVRDLWMALRGENFVFSFKNTLEMRAYRKLETKCTELERNMRHGFVDLLGKLYNKAQKGDLTTVSANEIRGNDDVSQLLQKAEEECNKFFEEDVDKEALLQWKDKTIIHLGDCFNECVDETVREAKIYIRVKECKKEVEEAVGKYEKEIIENTKELAQKNKGIKNEKEGKKIFDDMFNKYLNIVEGSTPEPSRVDVEYDARESLRAHFFEMPNVQSKINETEKERKFIVHKSIHLTKYRNWVERKVRKWAGDTQADELHVKRAYEDLVQMAMTYIKDKRGSDYSKSWFKTIIDNVLKEVEQINSTPTGKKYELHKEFCLDSLLHIFCLLVPRFKKMHEEFMRINNPANLLREKRDSIYQYFTTAYDSALAMVSLASIKCEQIIEGYRGCINGKIFSDVSAETTLMPELNGNKSKLEAHGLIDLIKGECFEDLLLYINEPKQYYERFIRRCVKKRCGTGDSSPLRKIIKAAVDHYHKWITKCMKDSTEDVKSTGGNVDAWLDALCGRLGDNVPFKADYLKEAVTEVMQSDVKRFQDAMLAAWDNVNIDSYTDNIYRSESESIVDRDVEEVIKGKFGCLEHCPFCKAVCCCTKEKHDGEHSVVFHRPQAIGGWRSRGINEAVLDICSTLVKSEVSFSKTFDSEELFKYKEYRKAGPPFNTWSITPDDSSQKCWKWIVCHFSKKLENKYKYKFEGKGRIPSGWTNITKEEAIACLKEEIGE